MRCVTLLSALLVSGCLIPPPIEKEGQDGGPNHPPQILWNILTPPQGPLTRAQTAPGAAKKVDIQFVIGVDDPDPQTLHLNIFIDGVKDLYANPIRSEQLPPSSTPKRAFLLDLSGPCDELVNFAVGPHILEAYVSDSGFKTEGEERLPKEGGQAVGVPWLLTCVLPPPSPDGGL